MATIKKQAAATTETQPEPETPKAPTFGSGKYTFTLTKAETIPVSKPVRAAPARLWFEEFFQAAFESGKAEEAHGATVFVPDSFWTAPKAEGGRELGPQKPEGLRAKYRDAFNRWQKETTENEASTKGQIAEMEKLQLLLIRREEGQENGAEVYKEAGFSLFLVDKSRS